MYNLRLLYLFLIKTKKLDQTHLTPAPMELFKDFQSSLSIASPGRINLIGEHTDYNQGFVLPTAIDRKIYFEFAENRSENICNVYSQNLQEYLQIDLRKVEKSETSWHNYILGVVFEIQQLGKTFKGFDCTINSEVPSGAGVSSSAALECGLATGLNELFDLKLSKDQIVSLSMRAEHNFVGTKCGIMDQFASVMSKKDSLIFLDCQSLEANFIPANFKSCKLLLLNTMVSHNLADSEYNTRRTQCEQAVKAIREEYPEVSSLRDVSIQQLQKLKLELPEVLYKRASYVIEENQRVKAAVHAMKEGDLKTFGELMYGSHQGLSSKYEVSCPELDFLVNFSKEKPYIYGSRMMGGGFGGCTISIIEEDEIETYVSMVSKAYKEQFNIDLKAFPVLPSEGTTITKNA